MVEQCSAKVQVVTGVYCHEVATHKKACRAVQHKVIGICLAHSTSSTNHVLGLVYMHTGSQCTVKAKQWQSRMLPAAAHAVPLIYLDKFTVIVPLSNNRRYHVKLKSNSHSTAGPRKLRICVYAGMHHIAQHEEPNGRL